MPYIEHPLGKTFYKKSKKVKGKIPLVFLHGGPGGNAYFVEKSLENFKDRQVYIYDQLGAARSTRTSKEKWNIETYVKELEYLIEAWGLKEFHLMGASWGTTLALEYYLRKKGRGVKSLIFQSPMFHAGMWAKDAAYLISKMPKKWQKVIHACQEVGATDAAVYKEAEIEFMKRFVYRGDFNNPPKHILLALEHTNNDIYKYMWGDSEFCPTGKLKNYNRLEGLKRIKVPCLLFCGEHDEVQPRTCEKFHKKIPGSKFKVLKGCSHISNEEKPELHMKTVREFLDSVE